MDRMNIEAVCEGGALRLPDELPLGDGQKDSATHHGNSDPKRRHRGLIHWTGSQQDLDCLILSDDDDLLESP